MKTIKMPVYDDLQVGDLVVIDTYSEFEGERYLYRLIVELPGTLIAPPHHMSGAYRNRIVLGGLDGQPPYDYGWWPTGDTEDWTLLRPTGEPIEWLIAWHQNGVPA